MEDLNGGSTEYPPFLRHRTLEALCMIVDLKSFKLYLPLKEMVEPRHRHIACTWARNMYKYGSNRAMSSCGLCKISSIP